MPARDIAGFSADLKKFSKMLDIDVSKVRRKIVLDLSKGIINRTPVDTGRAAASWNVSDGAPNISVAAAGGQGGQAARAAALSRAAQTHFQDPFATSYIVNALPYIERLEFGYSKQAPTGMVRISLAEVEAGIKGRIGG